MVRRLIRRAMTGLEALSWCAQLLVPLVLVGRVALRRHESRAAWRAEIVLAASYLMVIALAGLWLALPRWLILIYGALLLAAAFHGLGRITGLPGVYGGLGTRIGRGARAAVIAVLALASIFALTGRRPPSERPVNLAFPLGEGIYLVAAGGSNALLNPHLKTRSAERFRAWRGQSFAVDLVKIGGWGSRIDRPSPDEPYGFAIFGERIHAPCSGTVVRADDGDPDWLGEGTPPADLEGNHVILSCDAAWILVAHMKRGTVTVSEGDLIAVGDVLGRVGNSGRSDEPHLHIHAQTPGTADAPLGGTPIPITFAGRHLVRNDRVRGTPIDQSRSLGNPIATIAQSHPKEGSQ